MRQDEGRAMARPHSIRFKKFHVWLSFNEQKLEFCVGVRADFAVQIDFFMLRCGPFHGYHSLVLVELAKSTTDGERAESGIHREAQDVKSAFAVTKKKRKHSTKKAIQDGTERNLEVEQRKIF